MEPTPTGASASGFSQTGAEEAPPQETKKKKKPQRRRGRSRTVAAEISQIAPHLSRTHIVGETRNLQLQSRNVSYQEKRQQQEREHKAIHTKIGIANGLRGQERYDKAKEMVDSAFCDINAARQSAIDKELDNLYGQACQSMAYILCEDGDAVVGLQYFDKSAEYEEKRNIAAQLHFLAYRFGIDPFLLTSQEEHRVLPCCQPALAYAQAAMLSRNDRKVTAGWQKTIGLCPEFLSVQALMKDLFQTNIPDPDAYIEKCMGHNLSAFMTEESRTFLINFHLFKHGHCQKAMMRAYYEQEESGCTHLSDYIIIQSASKCAMEATAETREKLSNLAITLCRRSIDKGYPFFDELVGIYRTAKDYQSAIDVCQEAEAYYMDHGYLSRATDYSLEGSNLEGKLEALKSRRTAHKPSQPETLGATALKGSSSSEERRSEARGATAFAESSSGEEPSTERSSAPPVVQRKKRQSDVRVMDKDACYQLIETWIEDNKGVAFVQLSVDESLIEPLKESLKAYADDPILMQKAGFCFFILQRVDTAEWFLLRGLEKALGIDLALGREGKRLNANNLVKKVIDHIDSQQALLEQGQNLDHAREIASLLSALAYPLLEKGLSESARRCRDYADRLRPIRRKAKAYVADPKVRLVSQNEFLLLQQHTTG